MRDRFAAMLAVVLVGGCQAQDESIGGLLSSNAQFAMSDDRCTISMLFDNFELRRPAVSKVASPTRSLSIAGGAGWPFTATVKGTKIAPGTAAELTFKFGGQSIVQTIAPASEEFEATFKGRLAEGQDRTDLSLTAALAEGEGEALLAIDTLDIVVASPRQSCR